MNLEFTEEEKLGVEMIDSLMDAIEIFGEEISGSICTPVVKGLYNVDEKSKVIERN